MIRRVAVRTVASAVMLVLLVPAFGTSQSQGIDAKRFSELQRKQQIGRELTPEETAYIERALRLIELMSQPRENLTPAQLQSIQAAREAVQKWNQDF